MIIPGHGPAFHDQEFLNLELQLLEAVIKGVHDPLQRGVVTLDEMYKAVTVEELRERFTHGDKYLDTRYWDRVKAIISVGSAKLEGRTFRNNTSWVSN